MSETIIVALITGVCAIIGNLVISRKSNAELYARLDKHSELADEKIKGEISVIKTEIAELRDETRKHNGVIERTYHLEQQSAVISEQIKDIHHRLDDVRKAVAS